MLKVSDIDRDMNIVERAERTFNAAIERHILNVKSDIMRESRRRDRNLALFALQQSNVVVKEDRIVRFASANARKAQIVRDRIVSVKSIARQPNV